MGGRRKRNGAVQMEGGEAVSSDALEYFYGITSERLDAMKNTPPPKSTDEAWKEHYRLQEEYIEELEAENARLKHRIKRLEEAGDEIEMILLQYASRAELPRTMAIEQSDLSKRLCVNWRKAKEDKP